MTSHLRLNLRIALIISILATISACGFDSKFAELKKEIDDTREVVKVLGEQAIRAIPGERYLQLIDDLNGSDPKKKSRLSNS